jgi:hypothetical protein
LLGGFITTYLSWRVAFGGEVVIIAIVLVGSKLVHDVPYSGDRGVDVVGSILSAVGMGGVVLGILVWEKGGGAVAALIAVGAVRSGRSSGGSRSAKREGKRCSISAVRVEVLSSGSRPDASAIALGGMMTARRSSADGAQYNALEAGFRCTSVADDVRGRPRRGRKGQPEPEQIISWVPCCRRGVAC